MAAPATDICNP